LIDDPCNILALAGLTVFISHPFELLKLLIVLLSALPLILLVLAHQPGHELLREMVHGLVERNGVRIVSIEIAERTGSTGRLSRQRFVWVDRLLSFFKVRGETDKHIVFKVTQIDVLDVQDAEIARENNTFS
jgi:hypothetical protein